MDDLAIGRVLRELRIRLGWPQRVVAAKARISASAYSEIERGHIESVAQARGQWRTLPDSGACWQSAGSVVGKLS